MGYYIVAIYTLISTCVSLGFSIEAYIKAGTSNNNRLNTKYILARSAAIVLVSMSTFIIHDALYLLAISLIIILVHLGDGFAGIGFTNKVRIIGPWMTALFHVILLFWFYS